MAKIKLLISSCLLGENVKYNGSNNSLDEIVLKKLKQKFELYSFCPEVEAGLSIPRIPCEIISFNPLKIINKLGEDETGSFKKGAILALELCKKYEIKVALLKANSPSCSNKYVYDGSFSGKKILAEGVTAQLLKNSGIQVYNEEELLTLLD
jgi:uncharacterized protein YbbK (DUF523 family)